MQFLKNKNGNANKWYVMIVWEIELLDEKKKFLSFHRNMF